MGRIIQILITDHNLILTKEKLKCSWVKSKLLLIHKKKKHLMGEELLEVGILLHMHILIPCLVKNKGYIGLVASHIWRHGHVRKSSTFVYMKQHSSQRTLDWHVFKSRVSVVSHHYRWSLQFPAQSLHKGTCGNTHILIKDICKLLT